MQTDATPSRPRAGSIIAVALAVLWVLALVVLLVASPEGVRGSADPGAPRIPFWVLLLPAAVGLLLIAVLPLRVDGQRAPALPPVIVDRPVVVRDVTILVALAIVFPVVVGVFALSGNEYYILAKLVLLMIIPGIVVWLSRRAIRLPKPLRAWQWWAPAVVLVVWTLLSQVAPWRPVADYDWPDRGLLIAAATATLITAGIGEELFYRRWLQSRLEGLLGRWAGIGIATLLFAVMHLGGDRQGSGPLVEVAAVIVAQGSFGIMLGYLWSRYRNIWLNIAIHAIVNGYAVVVFLIANP